MRHQSKPLAAAPLSRDDLAAMEAWRTRFDAEATARKVAWLSEMSTRRIASWRVLRDYHELLLFMAAYADSDAVGRNAERELLRVAARAQSLVERSSVDDALLNSGIAGTMIETAFSVELLHWLVERFDADVDVCWEGDGLYADSEALLGWFASRVETDALVGSDISTKRWIEAARDRRTTTLAWLLREMRRMQGSQAMLEEMFEQADMQIRWRLRVGSGTDATEEPERPARSRRRVVKVTACGCSRTQTRLPLARVFGHEGGLCKSFDVQRELERPLPRGGGLLERDRAMMVIDAARATLAVRSRETEPVTHANPDEIMLYQLDRGVSVAIIGMQAERRLPIESFFGYVAAKNGVPTAYGGAWTFLHSAAIGINVFDTFRGGESAYVFGQVMRVYRQLFDVCRFFVDPFQFGADNPEAIASGAFWFYYRLGYRPTEAGLAALAADEWETMQRDRSHRSPRTVLRKLATGELALDLPEPAHVRNEGGAMMVRLQDVAMGVTRFIGERFHGSRDAAERQSRKQMMQSAGITAAECRRWSAGERAWFGRLSVLMAALPGVEHWPKSGRESLGELMRAKGGKRESEYASKVRKHRRFGEAVKVLAAEGRGGDGRG